MKRRDRRDMLAAKRWNDQFYRQKPEHRLGDAPVEADYVEQMTAVMGAVDELFNGPLKGPDKKVGIVILTFLYGDKTGRCNFMSNGADRRDIVTLFREMIARFEGQPEIKGQA
jgi:hypothetical protein